MAKTKKFAAQHPSGTRALTVYAVVEQCDTGYYLDDADGGFAAAPADRYHEATEDTVQGGLYRYSESRTVWADGPYRITFYSQLGGAPAPLTDTAFAVRSFTIVGDSVPTAGSSVVSGLCSLADVKAILKFTGSSFDQAVTDKIAAAENYFKSRTGYTLINTEHTEYFSPGYRDRGVSSSLRRLRVKEHPIISVTSLYESDDRTFAAADEIPAADYFFDDYGIELYADGDTVQFTGGQRTVRAIYRAGFATVPAFLRNGVAHHAAWLYYQDEPGRMRSAIASESLGDSTVTYLNEEAPKIVEAAIKLLKRPCGL